MISLLVALAVGATNPAVTQANIHQTICVPGYSASIRPPSSWTSYRKRKAIGPRGDMSRFQFDHLVPLSVGGAPRDPRNLWAQPIATAHTKDTAEKRVHALVCGGKWTLQQGQAYFIKRWGK